jgi:hypothetical protein
MQAKRSRDDVPHFDQFECLSCQATIHESKPAPDGKPPR